MATMLLLWLVVEAQGQVVSTESPFSLYGLGVREFPASVQTLGFGGVNMGYRSRKTINFYNPASYPYQDSLQLLFEFSGSVGYAQYDYPDGAVRRKPTGGMGHVAIKFPVTRWLGVAVGFSPLTQVGYDITRYEQDVKLVSAIGRLRYHHRGHGGTNQAFVGIGGAPSKYFSLGLNAHYVFGSLDHGQDFYVPSNQLYAQYSYEDRYVLRGVMLRGAVQAVIPCDTLQRHRVVVGASVDYVPWLQAQRRTEATLEYVGTSQQLMHNALRATVKLRLPLRYVVGAMYESPILQAGFDVAYEPWSSFEMLAMPQPRQAGFEVRAGVQYTPNPVSLRSYAERVQYRLGGYYERLPMLLGGRSVYNLGATVGVGLPFGYRQSVFHAAFVVGTRRGVGKIFASELYCSLHVGVSFNDFWFFKRKYD